MNALPVTHLEPDELIEGGKGCGGCHNMGVKSKEDKEKLARAGYRYQNNSCDECHTRHAFSKKETLNPRACRQCHRGFDHPQWEILLKALSVLHPETGEPTALLNAVKALDLARLTQEAWEKERERMIRTCSGCHAESYARQQLQMGDAIIRKSDRLMAEAEQMREAFSRHR
jgi:hypothetical protein